MTIRRLLFLSAPFFVLLFFLNSTLREGGHPSSDSRSALGISAISDSSKQRKVHRVKFFDEKIFNEGVNRAKRESKPFSYHVAGGVVPHDLFAGSFVANFFERLSIQKPTTIILLGPNHYEKGNFKALTSLYGWDTIFGEVNPNDAIINILINRNLVKVDEETLPNDHSLSGIMPFIRYYLPEAKVVPILLSGGLTKDESGILANNLGTFVSEDVVVVAAVDFSHYLTGSQAKEKDEITLRIIKDFDYGRLYLLNNDYLDSPPSIGTFLMVMQKLGTTKMDLLYHTNSGELQKNAYIQTTSYFSLAYY